MPVTREEPRSPRPGRQHLLSLPSVCVQIFFSVLEMEKMRPKATECPSQGRTLGHRGLVELPPCPWPADHPLTKNSAHATAYRSLNKYKQIKAKARTGVPQALSPEEQSRLPLPVQAGQGPLRQPLVLKAAPIPRTLSPAPGAEAGPHVQTRPIALSKWSHPVSAFFKIRIL